MKIVYLSSSTVPSTDANSVHVMEMCAAMARLGHDVHLFARHGGGSDADAFARYGIPHSFSLRRVHAQRRLDLLRYLRTLPSVVRELGPDLVYARDQLGLLRVAAIGAPYVLESHAPPTRMPGRARRLGYRWVEARLLRGRHLRRLVVISNALLARYLETFPWLDRSRVIVAHDGAAPNVPSTPPRCQDDRLRVGYVGHLYDGRGIDLIEQLAVRCQEMDFHVVGGTTSDVERWSTRTANVPNFRLHGFVPHSDVPALLRTFDIVLAPYQRGLQTARGGGDTSDWMSPLKIFEYLAAGRAIVASDLPSLREVLVHQHDGILAPPEDVNAWAAALEHLADPAARAELGVRARRSFEERFTWDARAAAVLAP